MTLNRDSSTQIPIKRALVSVWDKTGLEDLAKALHHAGVQIVSTGSTAKMIAQAGVPVTPVEDVTGFPECLEGRVKTLHPRVADWFENQVMNFAMEEVGEDLEAELIEADAKTLPEWVEMSGDKVADLRYGENPHQAAALYVDMEYLLRVAEAGEDCQCQECVTEPDLDDLEACDVAGYSEDSRPAPGIANAIQLHGKEMSYNNYTDGEAAIRAAYDHPEPCVAIIKHANPCGIAIGADVAEAHRKAHACDPVSAFGGVIAVNRPVTVELAQQIAPIFTEVVLAPSFEPGAVKALAAKKNLRVLRVTPPVRGDLEVRQISGGYLAQQRDDVTEAGDSLSGWTKVCGPDPDPATLADLEFAWKTIRATKSNAILLAHDGATVGIGMGQVNRVDSCRLAVERANTLGGRSTGPGRRGRGCPGRGPGGGGCAAPFRGRRGCFGCFLPLR